MLGQKQNDRNTFKTVEIPPKNKACISAKQVYFQRIKEEDLRF